MNESSTLNDQLTGAANVVIPSLQTGITLILRFLSTCFEQERKYAGLIGESLNLDADTITGLSLFFFAAFVIGAYSFVKKNVPVLRNGLALLALLAIIVLAVGLLFRP